MGKAIQSMVNVGAGILLFAAAAHGDARKDYREGVAAHDRGDVIAAMELLERAADQGHTAAMVRLGYLLDKAEENEAAFRIYSRAAKAGNSEAALALGVMYSNGEGVHRDPRLALEWMTRAADAGHGPAVVSLAQVYLRGDHGGSPSREKAIGWLEKGVAAGYEPARRELQTLRGEKPGRRK